MSIKKKSEEELNGPIKIQNHAPTTRRDFLAKGFIAGTAWALAPTMLELLLGRSPDSLAAHAQSAMSCGGLPALNSNIPVIIFDLSGGCNIAGSNVIVGNSGGQMDLLAPGDYMSLGLPPDMTPDKPNQVDSQLGLKFHSDSGFLRGIVSKTDTTTRAKTDGGIFCTSSADDTGNNPHNPMYWLAKAGASGDLAHIAGSRNSTSGGRSVAPRASINPTRQPVSLNSPNDALALVSAGTLSQITSDAKVQKILKSVERMSQNQLQRYDNLTLPDQIKELVKCGYLQTQDLVGRYAANEIDPGQDPLVMQAFGDLNNGDRRKTATIAKMVLDGHIGAGTIEKGGYDYHTGDRSRGEQRDFEAGELIGQVLQLAKLKQKDVIVYVFTDGGVSARATIDNTAAGRGKYIWGGDSGQRSASMMLVYREAGRATLRTGKRQIGGYKPGGSVDNFAATTSNSVINLNKAFVANYLALHGDEAKLADIVGDNPFGASLDQYLFFNKIR